MRVWGHFRGMRHTFGGAVAAPGSTASHLHAGGRGEGTPAVTSTTSSSPELSVAGTWGSGTGSGGRGDFIEPACCTAHFTSPPPHSKTEKKWDWLDKGWWRIFFFFLPSELQKKDENGSGEKTSRLRFCGLGWVSAERDPSFSNAQQWLKKPNDCGDRHKSRGRVGCLVYLLCCS